MAGVFGLAGSSAVGHDPANPATLFDASTDNNNQGVGTYYVFNFDATYTLYVNVPALHGAAAGGGGAGWFPIPPNTGVPFVCGRNGIKTVYAYNSGSGNINAGGGQAVQHA